MTQDDDEAEKLRKRKEYLKQYWANKRAQLKQDGICVRCRQEAIAPGSKSLCFDCLDKGKPGQNPNNPNSFVQPNRVVRPGQRPGVTKRGKPFKGTGKTGGNTDNT